MDYILLWFVMTTGTGYVPPQEARAPQCGLAGPIAGIQVDRLVNPTEALWTDPKNAGQHCRTDISVRVKDLPEGEYHLATTEVNKVRSFGGTAAAAPYLGIDPHTSAKWTRKGTYVILPPTVTCTVQSVGKYADGDAKLTVRCNTNGAPVIPKATAFTITVKL